MDAIGSAHAAALWVGLHIILLLVLSVLVVRLRQKHKIALGDEGIPELARAIRAFGNATEYVPAGLVAITVLAMVDDSGLSVHIVGVLLFVGRLLHAFALSNSGGTSMARAIGIVLTWVAYVFAAVALLFNAIA
ncbi:MAG TPA: MAPEG family protein [Caulobacteraceae bacterium]